MLLKLEVSLDFHPSQPLIVGKSIKFAKQKYEADRINRSIPIGTNQFLPTVGFGTQHGLEAELGNWFIS